MINIQGLKAKISEKGVVKGTANNKIVYEKLENIEELIDDINNEVVEGTAVDKLNYLDDTKDQIKEALVDDGVTIEDTDTFRNYAEKVNSLKALDIGGKNPVLVKEYHEEIPFSETNFPNIVPSSTKRQDFYKGRVFFEQEVDAVNFDYVLDYNVYIDFVYKQEVPYSSSYIIRKMYSSIVNCYVLKNKDDTYTLNECLGIFAKEFATAHKADTEDIQTSAVDGIGIGNVFPSFISNNTKIRVGSNNCNMQIRPNNMTADAFELIDTEKTKIVFDAKLYQVDKNTTPASAERRKLIDWVFGGN